jgi:hypothetical protein
MPSEIEVKDFGDYLVAIVRGNVRCRGNNGVTMREADNNPHVNDVIIKIVPRTVISAQSSLRMTSTADSFDPFLVVA